MSQSPKKYVSNFTSSTTNRGVSVKEVEIANTRLDLRGSSRSGPPQPPPAAPAPPAPPPPPPPLDVLAEPDESNSYIEVEVRRARRARLPAASSPAPAPPPPPPVTPAPLTAAAHAVTAEVEAGAGAGGVVVMPLLTCAGSSLWGHVANGVAGGGGGDTHASNNGHVKKNQSISLRRKLSGYSEGAEYVESAAGAGEAGEGAGEGREGWGRGAGADEAPERVEVYYFERGCGAWLASSEAAPGARLEAWAARAGAGPRALLAEALAAPGVALGAPLAVALGAERALLGLARAAATGALQTAADHALKPALALAFNALVHPPLVFVGNVLRAGRDALRPLWAAVGDALEPAVRLLNAARLVHVHVECRAPRPAPCACAHPPLQHV